MWTMDNNIPLPPDKGGVPADPKDRNYSFWLRLVREGEEEIDTGINGPYIKDREVSLEIGSSTLTLPLNLGSYSWTIPNSVPPRDGYRLSIGLISDSTIKYCEDPENPEECAFRSYGGLGAPFSIVTAPTSVPSL
jgi:hypothetical protein